MARTVTPAGGSPNRAVIATTLHQVYHGPSWLGHSVRHVLRGITARQAAWRPAPERNTIWELVLHLALSRHILLQRLTGAAPKFPRRRRKDWWAELPTDLSDEAWKADVALLVDMQDQLMAAVRKAPASRLAMKRKGSSWTIGQELLNCAPHDAYHLGQIALLSLLAPQ
jgi:uncharacterized damage-inducible protein DinB